MLVVHSLPLPPLPCSAQPSLLCSDPLSGDESDHDDLGPISRPNWPCELSTACIAKVCGVNKSVTGTYCSVTETSDVLLGSSGGVKRVPLGFYSRQLWVFRGL